MAREIDAPRIAIIGFGSMGRRVVASLRRRPPGNSELSVVVRHCSDALRAEVAPIQLHETLDRLIDWHPTLVVECATHEAVSAYVPGLLAAGVDVVLVSIGALANDSLRADLAAASATGGGRLILVAGGVGGLDVLAAARLAGLDAVAYVGRKKPLAWMGSPAEREFDLGSLTGPTTIFMGNAADAARLYPKNANVAASIALSGIGFERTTVELIADPTAESNIHEIRAAGAFGSMCIEIENNPLPDNPRTSLLAALSVEAAVRAHIERTAFLRGL